MFRKDSESPDERRGPRKLSELLPQLMARRGYARVIAQDQVLSAWEEVSGELSRASRPGRLRRNVLEIIVTNSVVMQELSFQKHTLLRRLGECLPHQRIHDLRFTVGPLD